MHSECARLRHPLSNHSPPTRRTSWRKARCAATRKRRSRSRTRTSKKAPPPPRRSPACTARRTRTRTARSRKPARRAATNTLPCRGRVDARSASGWGCAPRPALDARPVRHARCLETPEASACLRYGVFVSDAMSKRAFEKIKQGLDEVRAYLDGTTDKSRYRVHYARRRTKTKRLTPIPPGEILVEEFMKPNGVSQSRLSQRPVSAAVASMIWSMAARRSPPQSHCGWGNISAQRLSYGRTCSRPTNFALPVERVTQGVSKMFIYNG
jgi:hypothetical protein